ncbi:SsrA-binding protein [Flavobacterium aurantiibacter]|uniref:SsrA-binding protein n=1 Tax=Flavobacterium aurantiibacter TaxID=2023067 RepID=A0A255ZG72_9FLAO|nr:SsrA-binding protein [Flavobacterium sp.]OYQ39590.1 SsrA-binding protein [Flavobacterium aurantiibacter]
MRKRFFKILARLNKVLLPSFTRSGVNVMRLKPWQKLLFGYRYYVTIRSLD